MTSYLQRVPIPTGGLALGLAALGILFKAVPIVHWTCGCASALFLTLLIARIVTDMDGIRKELDNPVVAAVSVARCMALMQLTTYLAPYVFPVAFGLWIAAIGGHLCMMIFFTKTFIAQRNLAVLSPTVFVCYVGIVMVSLTSPVYNMEAFGRIIFWIGFAFYLVLLVAITIRYAKIPMPEAARPVFCIYAAPMSLSLAGYLTCMTHVSTAFVIAMALLAQAFLLLVLTRIPYFVRMPFYPSFAAMTFPFVITASALSKAITYLASVGIVVPTVVSVVFYTEMALAACMVLFVTVRYTLHFKTAWSEARQQSFVTAVAQPERIQ